MNSKRSLIKKSSQCLAFTVILTLGFLYSFSAWAVPVDGRQAIEDRVVESANAICDLKLDTDKSVLMKNDKYNSALNAGIFQVCNDNIEKVKAVVFSAIGRVILELRRMPLDADIRNVEKLEDRKLIDIVDKIHSTQIEI